MLDNASYNGDAPKGARLADGVLTWSGPLAIGATKLVTYSVTVNSPATGDRMLTHGVKSNAATGGGCAAEGTCTTSTGISSYSVVKKASVDQAKAGERVDYTITVTNTGTLDYTPAHPATFTDDRPAVLDDADYNADASTGASYSAPVLSWAGALKQGNRRRILLGDTREERRQRHSAQRGDAPVWSGRVPLAGSNSAHCSTTTAVDPADAEEPVTPVDPADPTDPTQPADPDAPDAGAPGTGTPDGGNSHNAELASSGVQIGLWASLALLLLGGGGAVLIVTRRIRCRTERETDRA